MDELYRLFLQIAGQRQPELAPVQYGLADVIGQLDRPPRTAPQTVASRQTQSQSADTESGFTKVLKSAFGIAPLIGGLIDLFSGSDEPPPLTKYTLPSSIQFQAAETRDGLTTADYDQSGAARAYPSWGMGDGEWGMGDGEWGMGDGERGTVSTASVRTSETPAPQITVNVQAMDA